MRSYLVSTAIVAFHLASPALAQEKCFSDAKNDIQHWIEGHSGEVNQYANLMERARGAGKDPAQVYIEFRGLKMPMTAAYSIVRSEYDRDSKIAVESSVDTARQCAKDVQLPRAAYDVAREYLGLTTVLPESVTRVDFSEIKAGNIFGSSDALLPKALEDARKAVEKAGDDVSKGVAHAGQELKKATDDLIKAADPRDWRL